MDEEIPLDERIGMLAEWCASPPDGADVPGLIGLLGVTLLERYEQDDEPMLLESAIARLGEALSAAPDHDDRTQWYFGLGLAHGELAARRRDPAEYDRAIEWFRRLHETLPPADPDRDPVAVMLADAHWERFWACRYDPSCDDATAVAEARRLVAAVGALTVHEERSEPAAYRRLVLGLGHLACFDETGDRPDLAAGIAALASALGALPPETDRYGFARAELCRAYQERARLDHDPASLDLAITTGAPALDQLGPDEPARLLLSTQLAMAYQTRWDDRRQSTDLDHGIACWQALLDADADPLAAHNGGYLRHQRASLTDDPAEAAVAVRLLEHAAGAAGDQPDDGSMWYDLAQAHRTQWRLSRTPGSLEAAGGCLDHLLTLGTPDHDRLLAVHIERVMAAKELLDEEGSRAVDGLPPSAVRLRRCLADARDAVDRAGTADPDLRGIAASVLAFGELYLGAFDLAEVDLARVRGLLALGREVRDAPPGWSAYLDGGDGVVQYAVDAQRPGGRADLGVGKFLQATASEHMDQANRQELRRFLPVAVHGQASSGGSLRGVQAAGALLDRLGPTGGGFHAIQSLLTLASQAASGEPHDHAERLAQVMEQLSAVAALAPGRLPGTALLTVVGQYVSAVARGDLPSLRELAQQVTELVAELPADHTMRLFGANLGGLVALDLARHAPGDRPAARRAAEWFEEATRLAGGPDHPLWALLALGHAESLRLAGDREGSRRSGRSALRAHGWQAMLQSGTDFAVESARRASADALTVAGWCLDDGAHDDLVSILDAGRGLVLHSATASRQVTDRLVDAGHPELAEEWRATGGLGRDQLTGGPLGPVPDGIEIPDDLRLRVVRALGAGGTATSGIEPLETIGPGEIQQALATVGADALVYLVPASGHRGGTAVIVPASGPVDTIALPELVAGPDSPVSRHVTATAADRDASPLPGVAPGHAGTIDRLCRWAWSAAMGEVIRYVRRRHPGRAARLVLVPMGMLALVPWHAARTGDGAGRRYAVQDAVISYSVSARMLCAAARHPLRPIRSALVVGDPEANLPFAGVEAHAIHQRFYPEGSYFGRHGTSATPTGTPGQVLDWVSSAAPGPSLLHFACHGMVDPRRPADAHLVLAGGTLTARRLLEASRLAALAIDRVFLAACTSNVSGADYDEAFSLSTAFLAAGAHTVFGSLWPVPDSDTSLLMYLVHHFLTVDSCAPVDALHRAQLWMLDPGRRPLDGMPDELARLCASPGVADPVAWAGFTHLGR